MTDRLPALPEFRHDAWFSGFIDGEGCFTRSARSTKGTAYPRFQVGLREDDLPVLHALRLEFGGSITNACVAQAGRRRPAFQWRVSRPPELWGIVQYLEEFPLRARKAEQYAIWFAEFGDYLQKRSLRSERALQALERELATPVRP